MFPSWVTAGALAGGVFYALAAHCDVLKPATMRLAHVHAAEDADRIVPCGLVAELRRPWWGASGE
jgi:hypothetical protein